MSLTNGENKKYGSNGSGPQLRLVALLMIAIVGCAAYFRLASSHDVHALHQLPISKVHLLLAVRVLIVAFLAYLFLIPRIKRWIYNVGHGGEFDRALRLNRFWSVMPFYGSSLKGPILFNAGRYSEAIEFLKPLAFDRQGKPRLTSVEFYTYAIALENSGREAEAQKLLEAAVQVPQRTAGFHVALATCLLSQKKDAERARELMEQALATPDMQTTTYGRNSDYLMRLARYAWALAACGRCDESKAQLAKAFDDSSGLKDCDLAGLQYFAGEAWRSMADWKKARAAFEEALRLSPDGPAATGAKKALAKMRAEAQS